MTPQLPDWPDWTAHPEPFTPTHPAPTPPPPTPTPTQTSRPAFRHLVTFIVRETLAVDFPDAFDALVSAFHRYEQQGYDLST